jgi:hypothetical protein
MQNWAKEYSLKIILFFLVVNVCQVFGQTTKIDSFIDFYYAYNITLITGKFKKDYAGRN